MNDVRDHAAHSRIDAVVSQVGEIRGEMTGLRAGQESNTRKLDGIGQQTGDIAAKLDLILPKLTEEVGEHGERIVSVEHKSDLSEAAIAKISGIIDASNAKSTEITKARLALVGTIVGVIVPVILWALNHFFGGA